MGNKRKTKNRAAVRGRDHPSPDIRVSSADRESEKSLSSREGSPERYSPSAEKEKPIETTCNNTGHDIQLVVESSTCNTHLTWANDSMSVSRQCSENTGDIPVSCSLYENLDQIANSCVMSPNTGSVPVMCNSFQNIGYVPVTCTNTMTQGNSYDIQTLNMQATFPLCGNHPRSLYSGEGDGTDQAARPVSRLISLPDTAVSNTPTTYSTGAHHCTPTVRHMVSTHHSTDSLSVSPPVTLIPPGMTYSSARSHGQFSGPTQFIADNTPVHVNRGVVMNTLNNHDRIVHSQNAGHVQFIPPVTLIPQTISSNLSTRIDHQNQHQGYIHPRANDTGHLPVSPSICHLLPRSVGSLPATCAGHLPVSSIHSMPVVSSVHSHMTHPLPTTIGHNASHVFAEDPSPFPSHGCTRNRPSQPTISDATQPVNLAEMIRAEVGNALQNLLQNPSTLSVGTTPGNRDSISENEDYDENSTCSNFEQILDQPRPRKSSVKIPPFTGKEDWKIWYARFDEMAERRRWSELQRLDELLPRLHDTAAEFVYGQLPKSTRKHYLKLIQELNNRFRVVETRKTFIAKFSNRQQKPGEKVEDYAADLKRLYDKAHPKRNADTREEDLLRRFLDGLSDKDAQFHVEYVKEPENIDEAVLQVVSYEETGRGQKQRVARQVREQRDEKKTNSMKAHPVRPDELTTKAKINNEQTSIRDLQEQLEKVRRELEKHSQHYGNTSADCDRKTQQQRTGPNNKMASVQCYCCKAYGHFARDCPQKKDVSPQESQSVAAASHLNGQ